MNAEQSYAELLRLSREKTTLASCAQLLQWDAEICMPKGGVNHRGEQMALIAGLVHDRATDPRYGELLSAVEESDFAADPDTPAFVNVRELRRDFDRETRLPRRLVEELARTAALSSQSWTDARERDDFASFAPWLEKTFALAREKADAFGFVETRYDALLEDYEPGATTSQLSALFAGLRNDLVPLVQSLKDRPRANGPQKLEGPFPVSRQRKFSEGIAPSLGFDVNGARFDIGPHPFCAFVGPGDVRIALRYHEHNFFSGFLAVMHEVGHGLYEQGLDPAHFGTPMGESVSLGIHESQSRLWENLVGRSEGFWTHMLPSLTRDFPDALRDVSVSDFRRVMNTAEPGLIRVEADEVSYNLHVLVRFELEKALLSGDLASGDVPGAWSELYQRYLGLTPPNDREGCLQDIHWSEGLIGYFPTYTLGNLYAAQLFDAANRDIGPLDASFAAGEFVPLREWLRDRIHRHGKKYRAADLIQRATGRAADSSALVASLTERYS